MKKRYILLQTFEPGSKGVKRFFQLLLSAIFQNLLHRDLSRLRRLTLCFGGVDFASVDDDNNDADDDVNVTETFATLLRQIIETSERIESVNLFVGVIK